MEWLTPSDIPRISSLIQRRHELDQLVATALGGPIGDIDKAEFASWTQELEAVQQELSQLLGLPLD